MERDEDIMMRGTKQEMPGFRFRLLRPEKKRELWNPDFELLFLLRGSGRVSYEDGEVHNLPMGSIFAVNRFQICDLDLDEDGLALSLCVSAETIASFHIKLLKCEVKCQSFFYMEDQQEKFDLIRRDMARIFLEMYKNNCLLYTSKIMEVTPEGKAYNIRSSIATLEQGKTEAGPYEPGSVAEDRKSVV